MKVFSNSAMSLDGKLATPWDAVAHLGSPIDQKRMQDIRSEADAVLIGGNTFRHWPYPENENLKYCVILSRSLALEFPEELKIAPLILTDNNQDPDWEHETLFFKKITPQVICDELQKRGVKNLLVEAGGSVIFDFLNANLLDEIYVTVCPKLVGGLTSPTLVDGAGWPKDQLKNLSLISCEQIEDELFLKYQVLCRN